MQKYPSCRYHPELGTMLVHDEEEDRVLTPASDGWSDTPAASVMPEAFVAAEREAIAIETSEVRTEVASEVKVETEPEAEIASLDFRGEFVDGEGSGD